MRRLRAQRHTRGRARCIPRTQLHREEPTNQSYDEASRNSQLAAQHRFRGASAAARLHEIEKTMERLGKAIRDIESGAMKIEDTLGVWVIYAFWDLPAGGPHYWWWQLQLWIFNWDSCAGLTACYDEHGRPCQWVAPLAKDYCASLDELYG